MSRFKGRLITYLLGGVLVLLFLGHAAQVWRVPLLEVLDAYFYDARVRLTAPGDVDERVVIVDLDERSLAAEGRWPWGRDKVAELVRRLVDDYGVTVIGFDVVFAEPDDSSGVKVLDSLARGPLRNDPAYLSNYRKLQPELDFDGRFADTLKERPVVLGYYFSARERGDSTGLLPEPVFPPGSFEGIASAFIRWQSYGANLPQLQAAATAAGHFNPLVDFDGVSRRIPLLVEYQGAFYEALSLAVLRTYLGGNAQLGAGTPDPAAGLEWVDIVTSRQSFRIPVDENVGALIPYRGAERSFPYVSATDVLHGRVPAERLEGTIVLVGTSAPGLMDLRVTPVGSAYPGVEVHANMITGILDGAVKARPAYTTEADALLLLLFGIVLVLGLPRLSPVRATLLSGMVLGLLWGINYALWVHANLVLSLAAATAMVLSLYGLNTAWGFFVEARSKRQFAEVFGQYVPPELVQEMARNPEAYSMEGRNAELTVLFADVRSFTTLSEGMDPKSLAALMNEYLGAMTQVIRHHRGTLDKYIGDAIMAFWGAPVDDAEHARRAVLAALEMQRVLRELDEPFKARGWPPLHIGVGINTGLMTVGDMGSPVRKAYTVMGDAVNLASRLEGLTKFYGVGIIVGEATRTVLPELVFRELDRVRVVGKELGVGIFEPLGREEEIGDDARTHLATWTTCLSAYRHQDWEQAERLCAQLREQSSYASLCALYLERIRHFRVEPPGPDWNGVTTYQTK